MGRSGASTNNGTLVAVNFTFERGRSAPGPRCSPVRFASLLARISWTGPTLDPPGPILASAVCGQLKILDVSTRTDDNVPHQRLRVVLRRRRRC